MTASNETQTCPQCGHQNASWRLLCEKCNATLARAAAPAARNQPGVFDKTRNAQAEKLPAIAHFLCGWPLILVGLGGLIGGALGGIAYAINLALYKSSLPGIVKLVLNLVVGFSAIGIWLAIAVMLRR